MVTSICYNVRKRDKINLNLEVMSRLPKTGMLLIFLKNEQI